MTEQKSLAELAAEASSEERLTSNNGVDGWQIRIRNLVGVGGFEPPTSWSQTKRSILTELHPDYH